MATSELEQLEARLAKYIEAENAVLKRQEYRVGEGATARVFKFADLAEIRVQINAMTTRIHILLFAAERRRRVFFVRY